jgi:hypothetical protein
MAADLPYPMLYMPDASAIASATTESSGFALHTISSAPFGIHIRRLLELDASDAWSSTRPTTWMFKQAHEKTKGLPSLGREGSAALEEFSEGAMMQVSERR